MSRRRTALLLRAHPRTLQRGPRNEDDEQEEQEMSRKRSSRRSRK